MTGRTERHANAAASARQALTSIADIPAPQWNDLATRVAEPNGYYLADWERMVSASARERTDAFALLGTAAADQTRLIGLLPVISLWNAYKIPLPALVSADPYGALGTPLLDRTAANTAAASLLNEARRAGARALILRDLPLEGEGFKAFQTALANEGLKSRVLTSHARACLDATQDAEQILRDSLGSKKLKELRRQRNRLADVGEVRFDVARTPEQVATALETFLALEASGWKAELGTALLQHEGDAAFIRTASVALAARGQCEVISLHAGETPVAAAVVLRHQDRAFYFKLGVDETSARFSPGVQLTLELTRYLCADPAIRMADSTAKAGHSMIDPIWRGRLRIGDVFIPLRRHDPMIAIIRAALVFRRLIREPARRVVHFIRKH